MTTYDSMAAVLAVVLQFPPRFGSLQGGGIRSAATLHLLLTRWSGTKSSRQLGSRGVHVKVEAFLFLNMFFSGWEMQLPVNHAGYLPQPRRLAEGSKFRTGVQALPHT